jgi:hypothetical protein
MWPLVTGTYVRVRGAGLYLCFVVYIRINSSTTSASACRTYQEAQRWQLGTRFTDTCSCHNIVSYLLAKPPQLFTSPLALHCIRLQVLRADPCEAAAASAAVRYAREQLRAATSC